MFVYRRLNAAFTSCFEHKMCKKCTTSQSQLSDFCGFLRALFPYVSFGFLGSCRVKLFVVSLLCRFRVVVSACCAVLGNTKN